MCVSPDALTCADILAIVHSYSLFQFFRPFFPQSVSVLGGEWVQATQILCFPIFPHLPIQYHHAAVKGC